MAAFGSETFERSSHAVAAAATEGWNIASANRNPMTGIGRNIFESSYDGEFDSHAVPARDSHYTCIANWRNHGPKDSIWSSNGPAEHDMERPSCRVERHRQRSCVGR